MYNTFHHFGGIIVAPGYTDPSTYIDGNPYGTSDVNDHGTIHVNDIVRNAAATKADASYASPPPSRPDSQPPNPRPDLRQ
jgi:hypothetical protein